MTRRGTFAHSNGLGEVEELPDGSWSAVAGDLSGTGPTPVNAIVRAGGVPAGMTLPTVLMQIDLTQDEIVACSQIGAVFACGTEWYVLPTSDGLEELSCTEHPDYEEVATIHGLPQSNEENDLDDNDFLIAKVGRIGPQYFEVDLDTQRCTCLGWFESPDEAAKAAAGADFVYRLS